MTIEIVDVPFKNGGSFHSFLLVYQRVTRILLGFCIPETCRRGTLHEWWHHHPSGQWWKTAPRTRQNIRPRRWNQPTKVTLRSCGCKKKDNNIQLCITIYTYILYISYIYICHIYIYHIYIYHIYIYRIYIYVYKDEWYIQNQPRTLY